MAIFIDKKLFALWKPVTVTPGKVHLCSLDTSKAHSFSEFIDTTLSAAI
jgi:hypothetical protein